MRDASNAALREFQFHGGDGHPGRHLDDGVEESTPLRARVGTGPDHRKVVRGPTIPGKCAAPPRPR